MTYMFADAGGNPKSYPSPPCQNDSCKTVKETSGSGTEMYDDFQ